MKKLQKFNLKKSMLIVVICLLFIGSFLCLDTDLSHKISSLIELTREIPENANVLDLSGYKLIFSDDFDSNKLDETKWNVHESASMRRGGYWTKDAIEVKNGTLNIHVFYKDGVGWCSEGIDSSGKFENTYGYYEIRCKQPKGTGLWSAFWLLGDGVGNVDKSGKDGAEIDIFECTYGLRADFDQNVVSHCVQYDGYEFPHHQSTVARKYKPEESIYDAFHTYGLEWTEDEYIFYVDGKETWRTDFGGVCEVPLYMIASIEVGGSNGEPTFSSWSGQSIEHNDGGMDFKDALVIDYIRVYAKN